VLAPLLRNKFLIESVKLVANGIGWRGADSLGLYLKANCHLTVLNLDCNPLGDEGIAALVEGLRWNGDLQQLSLQCCQVGLLGAGALAEDVIANDYCAIRELNLKGNEMGPQGVAAVAQGVQKNKTLCSLNLANTGMSRDPSTRNALQEALAHHPAITSIDLDLNVIGMEGALMLLEVLNTNKNIIRCVTFLSEKLGLLHADIRQQASENANASTKNKEKRGSTTDRTEQRPRDRTTWLY